NPDRFFATLRDHGLEIFEHRFPDHHTYVPADFAFVGTSGTGLENPAVVVMTEKDAVKCRDIAPADSFWLDVTAELPELFFIEVGHRLKECRDGD
ncbi:MAG: tetraacyldisaccharide 4'-kinase, partial [Gammaproteobacteria bacterium HGW-Gammaproteobacteria-7]